ncbi:hypothetical protein FA04_03050 [Ensifer adhaerens]|uniref:Flagellin N-terminal domain-containing protein n=1 Tax=Ensifer adhaerens TaxID=106592 RepID=A0ABY8HH24_ENSAD|nr:hypothetical protein [Ensifer adhaerens]ANK71700.1 hypothetical protein FA04_03050 [Ensifer adhaerens]KDP71574.1 hypothetical protein FA04_22140 [Ensifer adhaerens]WFP91377.1 hypothetical protein P4B07_03075 [Ensifer adhaerens]
MTSILTNISAMAALSTLINGRLGDEQERMSSGLRVKTAADNAAYWSIATTMKSDNKAISAIADTLSISAATIDVAYTGLSNSIAIISEIKSKLVTGREPGTDRSKIQKDISQLQDQMKTVALSASFNGQNWLAADLGVTNRRIISIEN